MMHNRRCSAAQSPIMHDAVAARLLKKCMLKDGGYNEGLAPEIGIDKVFPLKLITDEID
ncbi:MAG: hypothetical protein LBQ50_02130 [Planctomycetaceae bacterium]|nr:hypothetical protein [Planctomycetaceae bacterium]